LRIAFLCKPQFAISRYFFIFTTHFLCRYHDNPLAIRRGFMLDFDRTANGQHEPQEWSLAADSQELL
jgi:hypothetical protein